MATVSPLSVCDIEAYNKAVRKLSAEKVVSTISNEFKKLGKKPDDIAASLLNLGVKGSRGDENSCVLAEYGKKIATDKFGVPIVISVSGEGIGVKLPAPIGFGEDTP